MPRLRLAAVASISGAYDFRHAELPAILRGEVDPKLATLYLGYLLTSWDHLHGLYDSPSEVFRAPYDDFVTGLYDGTHPSIKVYKRMPATRQELLTKAGLRMLQHPARRFARALDAYDTACDLAGSRERRSGCTTPAATGRRRRPTPCTARTTSPGTASLSGPGTCTCATTARRVEAA